MVRRVSVLILVAGIGCTATSPPRRPSNDAAQAPLAIVKDSQAAIDPMVDPATGLIIDDGWELVRTACVSCHSPQQFLRQRGTRSTWVEIVHWMEQKGGLGQLPVELETKIVDYLVKHHGPTGSYRRAPIPPLLLPANPYESEIKRQLKMRGSPVR